MKQPTTFVVNESGYTHISTLVGDSVYIFNQRQGTYKHTAHIVADIRNGVPVTACDIWARGGTVAPSEKDCMVWCERGCLQAKRAQQARSDTTTPLTAERPAVDYLALAAAVSLDEGFRGKADAPKVTISNNVITLTYPSGKVVNLTATEGN